jgi:HK97 family phage portal protein
MVDRGYWLEAAKTAEVTDAPPWMLADAHAQRYAIPDGQIYQNQADLYRRLSWVQIAVNAVATIAAGTAFSVKRRGPAADDGRESLRDIPNHPFEVLLSRPNPLDSRFELLQATVAFRQLTGNAYWWLNRPAPGAPPDEIWPISPYQIVPVPDGNSYLRGYAFSPWGFWGSTWITAPPILLDLDEIVHFRSFNPNSRFVGLSPIEALATVATGDLKAQEYNANFFGEDNAKPPGALVFSEMVNDSDWEKIKADANAAHGGTRRRLMLMRGAGQKGVNWLEMGLTQDEMQFLQSRQFTKEEIFSIFAPGLASTLDVNATEANATTGKASLVEFAVWPLLTALAEKISTDLLPAYDRRSPRSLVGLFDDIRPTDRELELKEIDTYARFHTIDEVRQRYYAAAPLPDSQGARLEDDPPVSRAGVSMAEDGANVAEDVARKADLLPDEQRLLDAVTTFDRVALYDALEPLLFSIVQREVNAALDDLQIIAAPPVADWLADILDEESSDLAGRIDLALKADPWPGLPDWFRGWLARLLSALYVRARARIVSRLAEWLNTTRDDLGDMTPVAAIWLTERDERVCPVCAELDGMPPDLWREQYPLGPPAHPWCRCSLRLVRLGAPEPVSQNGVLP